MRALVTGAAGFIGSHLCERLIADGWEVAGVDSFSSYYDPVQKRSNATELLGQGLSMTEADLLETDLSRLLDGIDVVFHQAGQPGVRTSWAEFSTYTDRNVLATQRLLQASRDHPLQRFVFASSSSIYGDALSYPAHEEMRPQPMSPYGVTKLAAEHLCGLYARNWDLPTVALRYFTVFGPRQRPDMAMHRLIEAALTGESFPLFGTGSQIRDFTYVTDVVAANVAAATRDLPGGSVMNVAGGDSTSLKEVISIVEEITARPIRLDQRPEQAGDVARTGGSTDKARSLLGWSPAVSVEEGLRHQAEWHRSRIGSTDVA